MEESQPAYGDWAGSVYIPIKTSGSTYSGQAQHSVSTSIQSIVMRSLLHINFLHGTEPFSMKKSDDLFPNLGIGRIFILFTSILWFDISLYKENFQTEKDFCLSRFH